MRRIAILDAPSNLGLRPPTVTSVPGCAKAPGALRDNGLLERLHARDAGCLTPPRYDPGDWRPGDGVCHAEQINAYSRRLADRIADILDAGEFPVILGGDCSIVIGSGLAMHRLGAEIGGRIGLVFVDGHSDFRHPGNASYVGAAAGEDLALVTGRGQPDLAAIEGRRPYFRDIDVVVMGIRAQDEYRLDLQAAGIVTRPVPALRAEGAARSAQWARDQLVDCAGYWVHVDMDVLDPAVMPAVDAPSPGGIAFPELELLLAGLVDTPDCLGVEITVFDPDYDHDGSYAAEITSTLVAGLSPVRTAPARPDLVAARQDLDAPPAPDPVVESAAAWVAEYNVTLDRTADPVDPVDPADPVDPVDPADPADPADPEDPADPVDPVDPADPADPADLADPADSADLSELADVDPVVVDTARPESDESADDADNADSDETSADEPDPLEPSEEPEPIEPSDQIDPPEPDLAPVAEAEPIAEAEPVVEPVVAEAEPVVGAEPEEAPAEDEPRVAVATVNGSAAHDPARPIVPRPLGSAPLLDSEPLPATRPGMLRPRPAEDSGFTLPTQRPAFDLGSGEPADIT